MSLRAWTTILFLAVVANPASAQLSIPRLNSIFPSGGKQGTTVDCVITGGELNDATSLYFSHPGIRAESSGTSKFKIVIDKDVPIGPQDVRVVTPLGLSNFRAFIISDWPEIIEKESNNEPNQAQRIELPAIVNGKMDGGTDLDYYVFSAKKGERLLINCWAWRIDSQFDGTMLLTDAQGKELAYSGDYYGKDPFIDVTIPADGDYRLKIWDFVYSGGSDYFYRLQIGSLPHIDAVIPAAVTPGTKSMVTLYGRNLPGGKLAEAGMQILGHPLEMLTTEIEVPADPQVTLQLTMGEAVRPSQSSLDGFPYRITTTQGSSNPIFLAYTSYPILVEKEPNQDRDSAQKLPIPCDVTGMFAPTSDKDFYSFPAKKGERLIIEIFAERQSGLIDPYLAGFDSKGKRLFSSEQGGGSRNIGQIRFTTNSRDVRWDFTAPADGEYIIQVRDLYFQQRGSPRLTYRLVVHAPQPDFRLIAVPNHETQPDATVVGQDARNWLDILAFRQDGFDGPIQIEVSDLPPGVTCDPVVIGPGKTSAPLVFHATKEAPLGHANLRIVGKAEIDGKSIDRVARAGGLTWQTTNTPGVARMAYSIPLAVRPAAPFTLQAIPSTTKLLAGEKLPIQIKLQRAANWDDTVQLSGLDLPQNAKVPLVTLAKGSTEGKVEVILPANLKAGTYTFSITGAGQANRDFMREADPRRSTAPKTRVVLPSNPITITIEASAKK